MAKRKPVKGKKEKAPMIKEDKVGSLKAIARRDGGLKANGEISRSWARKKLNNPRTKPSTKKKIQFMLNFNK